MPGEGSVVIEGGRAAECRIEALEDAHDSSSRFFGVIGVELGSDGEAGHALGEHQHGPGLFTDQEIAFPNGRLRLCPPRPRDGHGSSCDP